MATNVFLPQWGMNMQDGTLTRWLKREGEQVTAGEPLVEVETAKINSDLEAPASGVLARVLVAEGDTVAVGTTLAVIAEPGETVPAESGTAGTTETSRGPTEGTPGATPTAPPGERPPGRRVQVVPAARRLARQHGIGLDTVTGSGPNGRILVDDVQALVGTVEAQDVEVVPLTGIRRTTATRMLESAQSTAPVTLTTDVDVTETVALRGRLVERWRAHRVRPMAQDFVVMAVSRALPGHRRMNAWLSGTDLKLVRDIHVGVALDTRDGLRVGVVRRASEASLLEVAQAVRGLAYKAKENNLSHDDVTGSSFTVTDLSHLGVDGFTPLLNPPEVGILGIGQTRERPDVFQGEVAVRQKTTLSLTFDHRALDGAYAARFLREVARLLEAPQWMEA